jgi:hypothetical protein
MIFDGVAMAMAPCIGAADQFVEIQAALDLRIEGFEMLDAADDIAHEPHVTIGRLLKLRIRLGPQ